VKRFGFYHKIKFIISRQAIYFMLSGLLLCTVYNPGHSQICPPNIDFETGTFANWTCYTGYVSAISNQNVIALTPSGPVYNRHTMYDLSNLGERDPYGGFPVLCPNGSGHSIRLGNSLAGGEAEGISYEFTIPAGQDVYSLIYHYAVVFQDPNHQIYQQPRMEIEITNVTDNITISCSSFTFIPYGSILPGFYLSPNPPDSTPVWCKDWSAVSINLDNLAGKTIRLFFKTADCTFVRHFGYAYIDVNSECSSEFTGATYCPDDTAINVIAPYGYQNYTWYNNSFTQVLGNQQILHLSPPPPPGTTIAVEVIPYHGYGCRDTLFANLIDTLTVTAYAGKDTFTCNGNPVPIGANAKPGLVYQWSPATGLSNPNVANPVASPTTTTTYVLRVTHDGGGCLSTDTVTVRASTVDNTLDVIGKTSYCTDSGDSTILRVNPATRIQWYRNGVMIPGATNTFYRVYQSGTYSAMLYNAEGCGVPTMEQVVNIERPRAGITYPVQYALVNSPITLQARQFGISILWKPATSLDNPAVYNPVFKGPEDQLYTIRIETAAGCVTVDTQYVKTIDKILIYVPTAFTPNNDGKNDYLHPILMGIKDLRYFRIYNRWGQLIYESKKELPGWDGKINGVIQSTQVVVWLLEGVGLDGKIYRRKGTTALIR
jgi:gliding motility-associated-like protein